MRASVYYPVSSEEQVAGYSLDVQSRATRLYCGARGWMIAGEYRDEGKSARTEDIMKRPAFVLMLYDAEARQFDVIVVHKLDRFARNLCVTLETLDRLSTGDVTFVSMCENMDFTTPIGRVLLSMLGAFAQYYSDNLSWETKKGKHERKRQGMYNGHLPYGVKKNDDGIPIPDPDTFPGLLLAFKSAAAGMSDREVAVELSTAGYRTNGNRGNNPFTKDTVRKIITNRFYLGELPDGEGGWIEGKHQPMLDSSLFDEAQLQRRANQKAAMKFRQSSPQRVYSLTGLAVCGNCGGPLHIKQNKQARPRLYCYKGGQGSGCPQPSVYLDELEADIEQWLSDILLPADLQQFTMEVYASSAAGQDEGERRRRQIQSRLERIKELYGWGDMTRDDYQVERDTLTAELMTLKYGENLTDIVDATAAYLANLPQAWMQATPEQRNQLLRACIQQVRVNNKEAEAVLPQPDFVPVLDFESLSSDSPCGSDGIRTRDLSLDRAAC